MCNINCIVFGAINLSKEEIKDKKIIEIGSCNVNGSLRPIIESYEPAEYIGVDIIEGPGVDMILDAEELVNTFGECSFDIVISTELLEHVRNWRKVISNIKRVCKPNGIILITTRSIGFPYHGYPHDYWRYELEDIKAIFSDCIIQVLEKDSDIGIFVKIKKPVNFIETVSNYDNYELYSIVVNRRIKQITYKDLRNWRYIKLVAKTKAKNLVLNVLGKIYKLL